MGLLDLDLEKLGDKNVKVNHAVEGDEHEKYGSKTKTTTTPSLPMTTTDAPMTTTDAPMTTTDAPMTTTEAPMTTTRAPTTSPQSKDPRYNSVIKVEMDDNLKKYIKMKIRQKKHSANYEESIGCNVGISPVLFSSLTNGLDINDIIF
jgi:hypothetical protein